MTSAELRQRFLDFFAAQGHTVRPSDSLIPSGDPTVLFTSAGMNQFKDYFLGRRTDLTRAVSCQKCLRTGDLDQVGRTPSHHSFFEMLGNFSFGDYFKDEAIRWGWEFLTGTTDYAGRHKSTDAKLCVGLPADTLWVSIYEDDAEAEQLWGQLGMPAGRIKKFGQAENFWPANAPSQGPNGPCGPCSEIYYDADGEVGGPNSVEVWNLVFTQFDRQPDGRLAELPKKSIDTGMGLERLAAVVQGVAADYETDLFVPIINEIHAHFMVGLKELRTTERPTVWTVADHLRAIAFLLSEKLVPSNDGRGYVLRMLIRRAHWHGGRLFWNRQSKEGSKPTYLQPFLAEMVSSVIQTYKDVYPELDTERRFILEALRAEERRFAETLDAGNEQVIAEFSRLKECGQKIVPGDFAFKMKDTYGYPLELLRDIAVRESLAVEEDVVKQRLEEQRERSRAASQFAGGIFVTEHLRVRERYASLPSKEEQFIGYGHAAEDLRVGAVIQGLWDGSHWVEEVHEGQTAGIILDRSTFYGEAGGQIGDAGTIDSPKGAAEVVQTTWADDVLLHHAQIRRGRLKVQEHVTAQVDAERRLKVARSHTATHLLHWGLRQVLGPEAVQGGSYNEAERLRFDFSSLRALDEEQRHDVEVLVNRCVCQADAVHAAHMSLEEARRAGALALFGEKYGRTVRVVTIGEYSKELCGGTHLPHTGIVGSFLIVGESSIAAGTRRIEALVGEAASTRQQQSRRLLQEAARILGRPADEVVAGLEELLEQLKRAERQRKALQMELARVEAGRLVASGKQINGVTFVAATVKSADRETLSVLADAVRGSLKQDGIVLLASGDQGQVALVMAATSNLAKRLHAGELLKAIAPLTQGSGGGRPEFAQAGGRDPSGIPAALKRAEELVRKALEP